MTISVFGNILVEKDAALVRLLPWLKSEFSQHTFIFQDPVEDLQIPALTKEWWILDLAEGIERVVVFGNLDKFVRNRGTSVHDYDLFMELKLQQKLGRLPEVLKIIAIPTTMQETEIKEVLKSYFSSLDKRLP
jgi:hypothetical protein